MATDQYPHRNVNMPMRQDRVDAARARLGANVPTQPSGSFPPQDGKGSKREIRPGMWFDDRVHVLGRDASPSKDTPPEWERKDSRAVPSSYDPLKVYQVSLGSPAEFCGRTLSPGKTYQMTGDTCTAISASIIDAVELGDIPTSPDASPSGAR
jgi:hypothetical protein